MDEDWEKLPLDQKLAHKNWKVRQAGYEELHAKLKSGNNDAQNSSKECMEWSKKIIGDANLVAQETGLSALLAISQLQDAQMVSRVCQQVMSALVEKCLAGTRAGTRQKTVEVILEFVDAGQSAAVVEELLTTGGKAKQPKVVLASVSILKELVRLYGVAVIDVKPIIKQLPSLFSHADQGVRQETTQLTVEVCKWTGRKVLDAAVLKDLKSVQQQELNELFDKNVTEVSRPEQLRLTREQKLKLEREAESGAVTDQGSPDQGQQGDETAPAVAEEDFVEAVNILAKIEVEKLVKLMQADKWKERKEALEVLLKTLQSAEKYTTDESYHPLLSTLSKRVADDVNILVVHQAIQCIQRLAYGLGRQMSSYRQLYLKPLMQRWKEKKLISQVRDCLQQMLDKQALTVRDCLAEDLQEFPQQKNPSIRSEFALLLRQSLMSSSPTLVGKAEVKQLMDILLPLCDDSVPEVRENSMQAIGELMKQVSRLKTASVLSDLIQQRMEKMDNLKKSKIQEYANVVAPDSTSMATTAASTGKTSRPTAASVSVSVVDPLASRRQQTLGKAGSVGSLSLGKKRPGSGATAGKKSQPGSAKASADDLSAPGPASSGPVPVDESQVSAFLEQNVTDERESKLKDGQWKVRLEAVEGLKQSLKDQKWPIGVSLTALKRLPCWSDVNFQVQLQLVEIMGQMLIPPPSLETGPANYNQHLRPLFTQMLLQRMSDSHQKVRQGCQQLLANVCEQYATVQPIADCLIELSTASASTSATNASSKDKSGGDQLSIGAKQTVEILKSVKQLVCDYGLDGQPMNRLQTALEDLLLQVGSGNALIRSQCTELLALLHLFYGVAVTGSNRLSSAQVNTLEKEVQRVSTLQPPPEIDANKRIRPQQQLQQLQQSSSQSSSGPLTGSGKQIQKPQLQQSEMVDVLQLVGSQDFPQQLMTDGGQWKARKELLDRLEQALKQNGRQNQLACNSNLHSLLAAMAKRLQDANKNLIIQTVDLLTLMVTTQLDRHSVAQLEQIMRPLMQPLLMLLNDLKVQVRQAVLKCMSSLLQAGCHQLLATTCAQLITQSDAASNLRKDCLQWLATEFTPTNIATGGVYCGLEASLPALIQPSLICLTDKSLEVRKSAQQFISTCLAARPELSQQLDRQATDLKVKQLLVGFLPTPEPSAISAPANNVSAGAPRPSTAGGMKKSSAATSGSSASLAPAAAAPVEVDEGPLMKASTLQQKQKRIPASSTSGGSTASLSDLSVAVAQVSASGGEQQLKDQLSVLVSASLLRQMFPPASERHKEREMLQSLTDLLNFLADSEASSTPAGDEENVIYTNSDLILRFACQFLTATGDGSSNTLVLKSLDLIRLVISHFQGQQDERQLTDFEAATLLLPSLLHKMSSGGGWEVLKQRIKEILRLLPSVYPTHSRLFPGYMQCLLSTKISKIKCDCLDEMLNLLSPSPQSPLSIIGQPSKFLPVIGQLLQTERDPQIRQLSIDLLSIVYQAVGEQQLFSKYLLKLPPATRDMLKKKFEQQQQQPKKSAAPLTPSKSTQQLHQPTSTPAKVATTMAVPAQKESQGKFSLDFDELNLPELSTATSNTAAVVATPPPQNSLRQQQQMYQQQSGVVHLDLLLTQITSGDVHQSITALKQLEKILVESDQPTKLLHNNLNPLVNAITLQIRLAFLSSAGSASAASESIDFFRLLKHLINCLCQIVNDFQLAQMLNRDTLHQMLQELITRLVDKQSSNQLTRAFNVLMLKILENCRRNFCFGVLLDLLDAGVAAINASMTLTANHADGGDSSSDANTLQFRVKFTELVMKCLWKSTKTLRQAMKDDQVDVGQLLLDIHRFLTTNPSAEWKLRAAENRPLGDLPLRTVKTILHEVSVELGPASLEIMKSSTGLEDPQRSAVYQYLQHMTLSVQSSDTLAASSATTTSTSQNLQVAGVATATPLTNKEAQIAVDGIFSKISSKDETKEGLEELYAFQKSPSASYVRPLIEEKLASVGVNFRLYILRSLQSLAQERGEELQLVSGSSTLGSSGTISTSVAVEATAAVTSPGDEAEGYKERLHRLQQMFGYSNNTDNNDENSQPVANDDEAQQKNRIEDAISGPVAAEKTSTLPSVLALKERLERMKSSMASLAITSSPGGSEKAKINDDFDV